MECVCRRVFVMSELNCQQDLSIRLIFDTFLPCMKKAILILLISVHLTFAQTVPEASFLGRLVEGSFDGSKVFKVSFIRPTSDAPFGGVSFLGIESGVDVFGVQYWYPKWANPLTFPKGEHVTELKELSLVAPGNDFYILQDGVIHYESSDGCQGRMIDDDNPTVRLSQYWIHWSSDYLKLFVDYKFAFVGCELLEESHITNGQDFLNTLPKKSFVLELEPKTNE